ncbi:MAG: hypothetical protein M1822_002063 [Bathelium mastoideum]|nr:MAG: hypothetical protein M1822_002063 [Bathelium mastoideum]
MSPQNILGTEIYIFGQEADDGSETLALIMFPEPKGGCVRNVVKGAFLDEAIRCGMIRKTREWSQFRAGGYNKQAQTAGPVIFNTLEDGVVVEKAKAKGYPVNG